MFKLPDSLENLSAEELTALREEATARQSALGALGDDELSDSMLDELESIPTALESIATQEAAIEAAATARADRIAAARESNKAATAADTTEKKADDETDPEAGDEKGEPEGEPEPEPEPEVEVPNDARELTEQETKEPVMASAAQRAAQQKAPEKDPQIADKPSGITFRSGTDLNGQIRMGEDLGDFLGVAKAFGARAGAVPKGATLNRVPVASFEKEHNGAFHLDGNLSDEKNSEVLFRAANEQKVVQREDGTFGLDVPAPSKAIVAAGGFMHPPVVNYDIPTLEQEGQGELVLPKVTMDRGSYRYTRGVDFDDIYDDTGFALTEEQVIADTPKHMTEVKAPEFEEVKLDLIGYGLRTGFLTAKAWPELIARYLKGVKVAHSHKKNATIIARVATALGAAHTTGSFGSVTADTLDALSIAATRLRYKYRLAVNAQIEGMAPVWMVDVLKTDLAYREGLDVLTVTDAQINAWLAARNIKLQWVYDWQDLAAQGAGALTPRPNTAKVGLWVPGSYVQGELDIVSMDMVYDTASLIVNTYTAAFFEEAISVFSPQGSGLMLDVPLYDHFGRTGAHDINGTKTTAPATA